MCLVCIAGKRAKRIVNRAVVNKERSAEELKKTVGLLEAAIAILGMNEFTTTWTTSVI